MNCCIILSLLGWSYLPSIAVALCVACRWIWVNLEWYIVLSQRHSLHSTATLYRHCAACSIDSDVEYKRSNLVTSHSLLAVWPHCRMCWVGVREHDSEGMGRFPVALWINKLKNIGYFGEISNNKNYWLKIFLHEENIAPIIVLTNLWKSDSANWGNKNNIVW